MSATPDSVDLFGFSGQALEAQVKRYASGVLAPAIWAGYERAGRAMCIAASEANANAVERAVSFVRSGGDLMVDSGAFIWRDEPHRTPWTTIIDIYTRIADQAERPVVFVLPDVVGSQDDTLDVLRLWGNAVLAAIGPRHIALLPVQRGSRAPSTFIKQALLTLSGPIGGLAIPSHAAAFSPEMLKDLAHVPTVVPRRVHFLGISRRSKALQDRLLRLADAWPQADISCDACEHRAQVGAGNPITEARSSALRGMWDDDIEDWDDTEEDPEDAKSALRAAYAGMDEESIENMMLSQAGGWVDLNLAQKRYAKTAGPKATTESIYQFATGQLG